MGLLLLAWLGHEPDRLLRNRLALASGQTRFALHHAAGKSFVSWANGRNYNQRCVDRLAHCGSPKSRAASFAARSLSARYE